MRRLPREARPRRHRAAVQRRRRIRTTSGPTSMSWAWRQGGLGMPDRDYYLSKDAKMAATRAAYLDYLTKMLTLAGEPDAPARAQGRARFRDPDRQGQLDPRRQPRRDQDLQPDDAGCSCASVRRASTGPGCSRRRAPTSARSSSPSRRAVAGIAKLVRTAPLGVLKDQLILRSLSQLCGGPADRLRPGELRLLRHHAAGHAAAGAALEAGGRRSPSAR